MRLSTTNAGLEPRFDTRTALKMLKDAGFDGVDYDLGIKELLDDDNYASRAREIRAYMDEIGLECVQTHGPFPFFYDKPLDLEYNRYLRTVRAIEISAILGAPAIVIHSIEMPKDYFADMVESNYRFYKSLQPYAEKYGIRIAVENLYIEDEKRHLYHAPGRFSTPSIMDEFMEKLDSDVFGICLDTGHSALCGLEPWMFIDNLKAKDKIITLHVHDVDYSSDTHTIPFNINNKIGGIDWERTMHSLFEAGYNRDLNLEANRFHLKYPDALVPDALAFSAKVGRYLISLMK